MLLCCGPGGIRARWALLTLALAFFLLIVASPALAAEPKFPALTGRVVDDAGVLNASTQGELTDMLAAHERATGEQIVVVTLESFQGYTIEDYGYQLGRHWGIGQKGKNTGALLIVVPKEQTKFGSKSVTVSKENLPMRPAARLSRAIYCRTSGAPISTPAFWPAPHRF